MASISSIAQKEYRRLEEKWKAAEREEERCIKRAAEIMKEGKSLLSTIETEENRTAGAPSASTARLDKGGVCNVTLEHLSEEKLSLAFAWLGEEEPRYWDAACGGLYSTFEDELSRAADSSAASEAQASRPVLRGVFAHWTAIPIGILVTKSDGLSVDFVSIRPKHRRRGIASAVVKLVEAQLTGAGIEVHSIESLEGAVDFWGRLGYEEAPDDEAEDDVHRSEAARNRRLAARRRRLPMFKEF